MAGPIRFHSPALLHAVSVSAGITLDEAADRINQVFTAIPEVLRADKLVRIPGAGRLRAPAKAVYVPGSRETKARQQRKAGLRNGEVLERGEPYETLPRAKRTGLERYMP